MCHASHHAKAGWWRGIPKQHAPAIDAEPGRACPSARAAYMRRVVHIYCLRLAKVLTLVLLRTEDGTARWMRFDHPVRPFERQ